MRNVFRIKTKYIFSIYDYILSMTELIQRQSLLMTDIDSDTYMLFPLIKNENDQVVLNNDDKNAQDLISVLTDKLGNEPDIQNLDLSKLHVESIDTTDKLLNEFLKKKLKRIVKSALVIFIFFLNTTLMFQREPFLA